MVRTVKGSRDRADEDGVEMAEEGRQALAAAQETRVDAAPGAGIDPGRRGPLGNGLELVRFESPVVSSSGLHVGVFGLANGLARSGALTPDDHAWWRQSNDWCNAAYPDPSTVDPLVYDRTVNPGAKAWFKVTATHLIEKTREYLTLLDRYDVPWVERRTVTPGRVVYEDDVQVVAVPASR